MSVMDCDVHGQVGLVETCSHIAEQLNLGNVPTGRRFRVFCDTFVCDHCYETHGFERLSFIFGLPPELIIDVDDDVWGSLEKAYESINERGRMFCSKCLAALEQQSPSTQVP